MGAARTGKKQRPANIDFPSTTSHPRINIPNFSIFVTVTQYISASRYTRHTASAKPVYLKLSAMHPILAAILK